MTRSTFNYRREAPALSTDSFNRANGGTVATALGSTNGTAKLDPRTWTQGFAGIDVIGLQIQASSHVGNGGNDVATPKAYHIAYVDLSTADIELRIDFTTDNQAGKSSGLLLRYSDDSNFWAVQYAATGPQINLYKRVATVETLVASSGVLSGLSGTLRVVASGNVITAYQPVGTAVVTTTDSFNNTATKHGLALRNNPAGSLNSSALDNWFATGL